MLGVRAFAAAGRRFRPSSGFRLAPTRFASTNCGIVGLPNVGKSTFFNGLARQQAAEACNYPFTTIEPNKASVPVPDPLLHQLAKIAKTDKVVLSQLEFVDVAGLVKGAHKGEGLGNKFLSNIRECSVILHVLRCFEDPDIIHVNDDVDPVRDLEIIETELMLADMQSLEKRIANITKKLRGSQEPDLLATAALYEKCREALDEGVPITSVPWTPTEWAEITKMQFLTAKPMAYVCNVDEDSAGAGNEHSRRVEEYVKSFNAELEQAHGSSSTQASAAPSAPTPAPKGGKKGGKKGGGAATAPVNESASCARGMRRSITVSSTLEQEAATYDDEARMEYLNMVDVNMTGLERIVDMAAVLLDLQHYYTVGVTEARSWQVKRGSTAQQAAGVIHSDIEKGFIRAEVIKVDDYVEHDGEVGVKAAGKLAVEGKEYIVQDKDILLFRHN